MTVDWRASFGKIASRYWITIPIYMVGVVALAMAKAWRELDILDKGKKKISKLRVTILT